MARPRILAGVAGAMTLVATLLPGVAAAEVPAAQVPDSLKSVIQQHIEAKGYDYAGFCRDANEEVPVPLGEYCIFVQSIEHDIAEITYGPVATNDITFVSFEMKGGAWALKTADTPYNPGSSPSPTSPTSPAVATPRPPSTGSGVDDAAGSGDTLPALAVAVVAGSLALAGAGAVAIRRG